MKLGEAIPKYQAYRNQLHDNQNQIYKKLKEAKEKAEHTSIPMSIMPRSTPPTEWKAALTVSRTKRRTSLISRDARGWKKLKGMFPKQRMVFKGSGKSERLSR